MPLDAHSFSCYYDANCYESVVVYCFQFGFNWDMPHRARLQTRGCTGIIGTHGVQRILSTATSWIPQTMTTCALLPGEFMAPSCSENSPVRWNCDPCILRLRFWVLQAKAPTVNQILHLSDICLFVLLAPGLIILSWIHWCSARSKHCERAVQASGNCAWCTQLMCVCTCLHGKTDLWANK